MYAQNRNVTYIADLPDLEELESRDRMGNMNQFNGSMNHGPPGGVPDQVKKFIRNGMGPPSPESGMAPYNPPPRMQQEFFQPPPQQQQETLKLSDTPSCLDIHSHVTQCPICSCFFNKDNSVYIIAIVVLCIICILLLKRVLNL